MERSSTLPPVPSMEPPSLPGWQSSRRRVERRWWQPRIPWTLYRYVAGELFRITLLGVFAVSLLYTTLAAYQTVRNGLQLSFIWPLLIKTLAYPLYFSVPVAFLFAVTLVLSRMVSDLEITAIRTHGLSYRQIYTPVLLLGVALAGVSFYLTGWVVPDVHYAKRNLHGYILDQLQNLGTGYNRTIMLPGNEGSLWVESYKGMELGGVRVEFKASRNSNVLPILREHLPEEIPTNVRVVAKRGEIKVKETTHTVLLTLWGVQILVPEPVKSASIANEVFYQKVATDTIVVPLSFAKRNPGIKDRTTPELIAHVSELLAPPPVLPADQDAALAYAAFRSPERRIINERRAAVASTEVNRRLAFTLSCMTFAILGVSLSLYLERWGRLMPFFISNLVVIAIYYPLLVLGVYLGNRGIWPMASMALPNVALLSLAVYLTRKVVRR